MDTKTFIIGLVSAATKLPQHTIAEILEIPKNPEMGDFAIPCFKLAAAMKKDPVLIAKDIAAHVKLPKDSIVKQIKVAGPYVNFFVNETKVVEQAVTKVLKERESYGAGLKKNEKLMIEGFGTPNTHKPFHLGHLRCTALSDSLIKIEKFYGYPVISANYIGDIGTHIAKWIWFYTKFYKGKIPKKGIEKWLGEVYAHAAKKVESHEKYHEEVAEVLKKLESKDKKFAKLWQETRKLSLNELNKIYKTIGVKADVTFYESQVEGEGKKIVHELLKKGLAKKDKGAILIDLKKYNLDVFLLLKSDGAALYSTKDLALAKLKFQKYKIDKSIYITAYEQEHYFKQFFKTLELMGFKQALNCHHLPYGLILMHGKKMASRAGDIVSFEDLFNQAKEKASEEIKKRNPKIKNVDIIAGKIALAALKYGMLKQSAEKTIDFDFERSLAFEGDTGPYLQYALVRAKKIISKAGRSTGKVNYELLNAPQEADLAKMIAKFPEAVSKAAEQYAPNIVANYAYDLANAFAVFYEACSVMNAPNEILKNSRLKLVEAFAQTLKNAFSLLGIEEVGIM